ncbi:zinc ribbon domain-containing protein [Namhaeicola litoreus]|uniref:Zinc ribbon domain-containing protein n=1 Tax=Namhaeicola litoreus TaxID=1052145 RepID=A0ABW3Y1P4_9FLAO
MANKEVTVESKLRTLYDLQLIDSRIDEIANMRGELPLEVKDLEDEVEGLKTRLENLNTDIENHETSIANKKNAIDDAKALMKKYEEQQKNVRNNREYDSLTKEIEYQGLEIQLAEKKIGEAKVKIEQKKEIIATAKERLAEKENHLKHKKAELDGLLAETEKEEKLLAKKSIEFSELIDERLLKAYKKIRSSVRNGLAVVAIDRGASGGSFFTIPPQRQVEIASRKKIITDEHSGRILIDAELAAEEKQKIDNLIS